MAITIVDQPTAFAKVGQKLMIVATSTNVAQPNFRYVVRVVNAINSEALPDVIVPPNPQGRLMFDLSQIVKQDVKVYNPTIDGNYISEAVAANSYTSMLNCQYYCEISVLEAYNVDGVFTIDEESLVLAENDGVEKFNFINARYRLTDGYKPDPNLVYSYNSITSLLMGGRKPTTHIPYNLNGATPSSQRVFIPVRKSELDWGSLAMIYQTTSNVCLEDITTNAVVRMTLYENDGTPNTVNYGAFNFLEGNSELIFLAAYPANLNAHGELLRPADFPNWRWYEIAMYDSTNTTRKSAIYTFYPVDVDCLHDNVRLGWWDAENGGFDFFNFSKKNEQTVEVERTRVQKVVGSYNATTFTFDPSDHELAEGDIAVRTYLDINSDYIQEGEFALLKRLITSPLVYIVEDSGALIPVLVDTNSYTSKKTRDGKLYNVSIRLRYSNELM